MGNFFKKILPAQQNSGAHDTRSHWFVSFPSWPWTNRHFDSLLHHEALQDDSNRGHCLGQNLQTWLSDWTSATIFDDVSGWRAFVIPQERTGLESDGK